MRSVDLDADEISRCEGLIGKLAREYESADNADFLHEAALYSAELPRRLRQKFLDLKYDPDDDGVLVVKGFPVTDVGPTPDSWDYPASYQPNLPVDYLAVLFSCLMGDVFGWETQQKGKLIHDLIPIQGEESAQTGYGSASELAMHTEDSFHKYRGDYVCFYCLRNDRDVPTTFASVKDLVLDDSMKKVLFEERFSIRPDDSHLDENQAAQDVAKTYLEDLNGQGNQIALMYGNYSHPFLCFDPYYMADCSDSDADEKAALQALGRAVEANTYGYSLAPGDICIVDNRKVVHGRRAFKANHDGTDRWLKRINITSSLRKSADSRATLDSRLIGEPQAVAGRAV